jgi:hypothetical protein
VPIVTSTEQLRNVWIAVDGRRSTNVDIRHA